MEIGTGIAVGCTILGAVAVVFRIFPNGKNKQREDHCPDHSGICEKLIGIDAWLDKIERKLDRVIESKK